MKPMTPEELEKFIHQQLRGLPARRAPLSLESRVMAAIEQRALIPWYHRSWSYWPSSVRVVFLFLATAVAGAAVAGFYFGFNDVNTSAAIAQATQRFSLFTRLYHVGAWSVELAVQLFNSIPTLWLYGGLVAVAALYATFFGLGAAAYRTLYRSNN
jgi:hypothetical protein